MDEILQKLLAFASERDWEQFHTPKNLSMALSVEASELMEHFQWLTEKQSRELPADKHQEIAYELADVFMYTLLMASRLDINLVETAHKKIAINHLRYPADRVRGSAKKHHEYNENRDSLNKP